jgi:hypothetical protein
MPCIQSDGNELRQVELQCCEFIPALESIPEKPFARWGATGVRQGFRIRRPLETRLPTFSGFDFFRIRGVQESCDFIGFLERFAKSRLFLNISCGFIPFACGNLLKARGLDVS